MRGVPRAPAARTAAIALLVLGLAGCAGSDLDGATQARTQPAPRAQPSPSADLAGELERTDAAVGRSEAARHGYQGMTLRSGQVDVSTTLPPQPRSVAPAVALCSTVVAQLDGAYRVSVRARNGRQLAFSVDGPCKRTHLKAKTTLWSVAGGSSGWDR